MKVYNFDRVTSVYLGVSLADPSPMEAGKFLVPAFATVVPVPPVPVGQRAVFDRTKHEWSLEDTIPEALPVVNPEITLADQVAAVRAQVRSYVNVVAVSKGFDSIDEAVGYADEPSVPEYQALGRSLRAWRSLVWHQYEKLERAILASAAPLPTGLQDLIAQLPDYEATAALQGE